MWILYTILAVLALGSVSWCLAQWVSVHRYRIEMRKNTLIYETEFDEWEADMFIKFVLSLAVFLFLILLLL